MAICSAQQILKLHTCFILNLMTLVHLSTSTCTFRIRSAWPAPTPRGAARQKCECLTFVIISRACFEQHTLFDSDKSDVYIL